jgi:iron complex transport system ATP-binding protein
MSEILEMSGYSCGYPGKFEIKDISLLLKRACFAGIVGPNGSGKTTLFRGIVSELPLLEGSILFEGNDFQSLDLKSRARKIAIVSQHIENIDITVEDYVLLGRFPYFRRFQLFESDEDYRIASYYINLTGIGHLKDKFMNQLSGGEQQLAAIARALTQQPQLLLLDEPTSHLDIGHQVQILNLIQELNKKTGLSVLMILHDLNMAGEYCDFLIMMDRGKVRISGTPEDVLNYQVIEEVYQTIVITINNPVSGKPSVFPVSGNVLKNPSKFND